MSSLSSDLKPLGIFWDISNLPIPPVYEPNQFIGHLREYLSLHYDRNSVEYEFNCISQTKQLNPLLIESLKQNNCQLIDLEDNSTEMDVYLTFEQIVTDFVRKYGFDSIVVLMSSNYHLSSTIQWVTHRDISVLLIYGQNSLDSLIRSAYHSICFDDVFLNRTVILNLNHLPVYKSIATIRNSFVPFCHQFNCEIEFNSETSVRFLFNNLIEAKRAEQMLEEINFDELLSKDNRLTDPLDFGPINSSSNSSLMSSPEFPTQGILPSNDFKCKSVIKGLFTKFNQNIDRLVRNLITSWNDPSVDQSMVLKVNRDIDFNEREGEANLIVTAIDRESNYKLVKAAQNFIDPNDQMSWIFLADPETDFMDCSVQLHDYRDDTSNCKSIITGLWTKSDENVLAMVRNIVNCWKHSFDVRNIKCVLRSSRFYQRDGKAALIVTVDSPKNNKRLLKLAALNFNSGNNKSYWKHLQKEWVLNFNDKKDRRSELKTKKSGSFAEIVSKSIEQKKLNEENIESKGTDKLTIIGKTRTV